MAILKDFVSQVLSKKVTLSNDPAEIQEHLDLAQKDFLENLNYPEKIQAISFADLHFYGDTDNSICVLEGFKDINCSYLISRVLIILNHWLSKEKTPKNREKIIFSVSFLLENLMESEKRYDGLTACIALSFRILAILSFSVSKNFIDSLFLVSQTNIEFFRNLEEDFTITLNQLKNTDYFCGEMERVRDYLVFCLGKV